MNGDLSGSIARSASHQTPIQASRSIFSAIRSGSRVHTPASGAAILYAVYPLARSQSLAARTAPTSVLSNRLLRICPRLDAAVSRVSPSLESSSMYRARTAIESCDRTRVWSMTGCQAVSSRIALARGGKELPGRSLQERRGCALARPVSDYSLRAKNQEEGRCSRSSRSLCRPAACFNLRSQRRETNRSLSSSTLSENTSATGTSGNPGM